MNLTIGPSITSVSSTTATKTATSPLPTISSTKTTTSSIPTTSLIKTTTPLLPTISSIMSTSSALPTIKCPPTLTEAQRIQIINSAFSPQNDLVTFAKFSDLAQTLEKLFNNLESELINLQAQRDSLISQVTNLRSLSSAAINCVPKTSSLQAEYDRLTAEIQQMTTKLNNIGQARSNGAFVIGKIRELAKSFSVLDKTSFSMKVNEIQLFLNALHHTMCNAISGVQEYIVRLKTEIAKLSTQKLGDPCSPLVADLQTKVANLQKTLFDLTRRYEALTIRYEPTIPVILADQDVGGETTAGAEVGETTAGAEVGETTAGAEVGETTAEAEVGETTAEAEVGERNVGKGEFAEGQGTFADGSEESKSNWHWWLLGGLAVAAGGYYMYSRKK